MGIKITKPIDGILNAITMYRLMLYYLIFLLAVASVLSFFSFFPFNFLQLLLSTAVILLTCYITNKFFSLIFKIPANIESAYISALILVFIVLPAKTASELVFIILVGIIAMASKYILAINKKHIFNPAAIAVFITSI
ncbi:MAG: oxidoreductase, partial [Patescibacteria group bacterium]